MLAAGFLQASTPHAWTTGGPDNGDGCRKFNIGPPSHPLRPRSSHLVKGRSLHPNSDLNVAVDFSACCFFQRKGQKKHPPIKSPTKFTRNLEKIPLGFLQKPFLDSYLNRSGEEGLLGIQSRAGIASVVLMKNDNVLDELVSFTVAMS